MVPLVWKVQGLEKKVVASKAKLEQAEEAAAKAILEVQVAKQRLASQEAKLAEAKEAQKAEASKLVGTGEQGVPLAPGIWEALGIQGTLPTDENSRALLVEFHALVGELRDRAGHRDLGGGHAKQREAGGPQPHKRSRTGDSDQDSCHVPTPTSQVPPGEKEDDDMEEGEGSRGDKGSGRSTSEDRQRSRSRSPLGSAPKGVPQDLESDDEEEEEWEPGL